MIALQNVVSEIQGTPLSFWAVDTHVHLAGLSASGNLSAPFPSDRWSGQPASGVLLLADVAGQDGLNALAGAAESPGARVWTRKVDCGVGYLESSGPPYPLLTIGGFQLVTREGLEVLALMMRERPADGRSLRETLEEILAAEAVPVLPWGVGKWLGRRGQLISELIEEPRWRGRIALADNANRPRLWPMPRLLRRGRQVGFAVLHGSNPLPLQGDTRRIGTAGVMVPSGPSNAPITYLRRVLRDPDQVRIFGGLMPAAGFVYRQAALRLGARI